MGKKNRRNSLPQSLGGQANLVARAELRAFSGPLPEPQVVEDYERILPGAAERIMAMAERQAKHRQDLERAALDNDKTEGRIGQFLGFGICVIALAVGAYVVLNTDQLGAQIAGGLIGVGPLATLAGVFVYGRRKAQAGK